MRKSLTIIFLILAAAVQAETLYLFTDKSDRNSTAGKFRSDPAMFTFNTSENTIEIEATSETLCLEYSTVEEIISIAQKEPVRIYHLQQGGTLAVGINSGKVFFNSVTFKN